MTSCPRRSLGFSLLKPLMAVPTNSVLSTFTLASSRTATGINLRQISSRSSNGSSLKRRKTSARPKSSSSERSQPALSHQASHAPSSNSFIRVSRSLGSSGFSQSRRGATRASSRMVNKPLWSFSTKPDSKSSTTTWSPSLSLTAWLRRVTSGSAARPSGRPGGLPTVSRGSLREDFAFAISNNSSSISLSTVISMPSPSPGSTRSNLKAPGDPLEDVSNLFTEALDVM
mmetsp:Transcript_135147/g.238272  ORF Transcript_135147/g.238272 Transcript_135147/m.238272 type:complete len:229 (-) Transcript_135147:648-1334(-)